MKSDWVVIGVVGLIGAIIIANRPTNSDAPASPTVPSRSTQQDAETPSSPPGFITATPTAPFGSPLTYRGYACTDDCSGHDAGYQWAEEHGIDDPDDCSGNSESFIEGCRAYAEEQSSDSEKSDNDD